MAKPTGSRPKPGLPSAGTMKKPQMNKSKPAVPHTSMIAPKKAANTKSKGGRRY